MTALGRPYRSRSGSSAAVAVLDGRIVHEGFSALIRPVEGGYAWSVKGGASGTAETRSGACRMVCVAIADQASWPN